MTRHYYQNHIVQTTVGEIQVTTTGTAYVNRNGSLRRCDSQWFSTKGVLAVFVDGKEIRLKSTPDGLVQE